MSKAIFAVLLAFSLSPAAYTAVSALGNLQAAIEEQLSLLDAEPSNANLWNDLANLLALDRQLDDAQTAYLRALELSPESTEVLFNLSMVLEQLNDEPEALRSYYDLLQLDPLNAWAHYRVGAIHEARGDREQALAHYSEAFYQDPNLLRVRLNPHIVENKLVVEALLSRDGAFSPVSPLPRLFVDRERIVALLVPPVPSQEEFEAAAQEGAVDESPATEPSSRSLEAKPIEEQDKPTRSPSKKRRKKGKNG